MRSVGLSHFHLQTESSISCERVRALTWGLPGQPRPADVGQQVIDVGGGLHVLRVHRRLRGWETRAFLFRFSPQQAEELKRWWWWWWWSKFPISLCRFLSALHDQSRLIPPRKQQSVLLFYCFIKQHNHCGELLLLLTGRPPPHSPQLEGQTRESCSEKKLVWAKTNKEITLFAAIKWNWIKM